MKSERDEKSFRDAWLAQFSQSVYAFGEARGLEPDEILSIEYGASDLFHDGDGMGWEDFIETLRRKPLATLETTAHYISRDHAIRLVNLGQKFCGRVATAQPLSTRARSAGEG